MQMFIINYRKKKSEENKKIQIELSKSYADKP